MADLLLKGKYSVFFLALVIVVVFVINAAVDVVDVVAVVVFVLVHVVAVDPRNQPLKFGQNRISNS